jgi:hypothetical protein
MVHSHLNLVSIASSDVGNRPASFLLDAFLVVVRKDIQQAW